MSSLTHLASIIPSAGSPLSLVQRPTPTPGPNELLIAVRSAALNPIDCFQRDRGFVVAAYPAVIGHDIAGTVLSHGSSVPSSAPKVGSRVLAFGSSFIKQSAPDYGALQEKVLVSSSSVIELPAHMSFNEGSCFPMQIATVFAGFSAIGLPFDTKLGPADKKGLLVWGAGSSMGCGGVQVARTMGYTVFATASTKHHENIRSLGASEVFDYASASVVQDVVSAAKSAGVTIRTAYIATGDLASCLEVVAAFGPGGKVASAPPLTPGSPTVDGVEAMFAKAPDGEGEREKHFEKVFGVWLKEALEKGSVVPSPKIKLVGGLDDVNKALDELTGGVSGLKLVVEVNKEE